MQHRVPQNSRNHMASELARPERFELPASWFVAMRSIQLSYGRVMQATAAAGPWATSSNVIIMLHRIGRLVEPVSGVGRTQLEPAAPAAAGAGS